MSVYWYGGGPADWAMALVTIDGTERVPQLQPGAVITCWNMQVGGDRITDLADAAGTPVDQITASTGDTAYGPGAWPRFRGPTLSMWVAVNGGPRVFVVSSDLPQVMQQLATAAQAAQDAAAQAAAKATELAGSSSISGHEADPDPHPDYLTPHRGDQRYLTTRTGVIAPLDEPREIVEFSETPAAGKANMREVWITHQGIRRLAAWHNERDNLRREQLPGGLFDHLYVAIVAHNGLGRAYMVQQRGLDGTRRDIGGFDVLGRPVTSDQTWTQIVAVDPDGTGDYTASTAVGPAPLGVRWDTDDVVRMQGRITATAVTAGDSLAQLPDAYAPRSARLLAVPTTTGEIVPCELLTTGRIVARRTLAGPVDLALDDLTYARVDAPQDTGDWTITSAGIATPGTASPLTVEHDGVTGRLYVLVLTRSAATDPFTGVSDDADNVWTRQTYAPTSGSVGRRIDLWTCQPDDPFTTVSIAFTGAATAYASLYEVTGHNPADPVDVVDAVHRSSTTTPDPLQITPSGSGRLVIAAIGANPNQLSQISASAGWTALPSNNGGPAVVYQTDPAAAPLGVAWTLATASGSGHVIAAFNPE